MPQPLFRSLKNELYYYFDKISSFFTYYVVKQKVILKQKINYKLITYVIIVNIYVLPEIYTRVIDKESSYYLKDIILSLFIFI